MSDTKLSPLLDDGREFVGFSDESTQVLYYSYTNKDRGKMIQGLAREGQLHHLLEPLLQFPVQEEGITASWRDTYQHGSGKMKTFVIYIPTWSWLTNILFLLGIRPVDAFILL